MTVVHSGFDGLKFTVQTDISPELRVLLIAAKEQATKSGCDCIIEVNGSPLAVRRSGGMAFSAHTGEHGAEWYFLDPENRGPNMPGVTVDFRAFLLATGGLRGAREHFDRYTQALGISFESDALRVSRADFAIDILAPWFEPNRDCVLVPPGTRVDEYTGPDDSVTHATGARVTGLRAGAIANRQLAIYDKRAEVIASGKMGWLAIWNASLTQQNLPAITLDHRTNSQVWRFEMRMGSRQLRNRWAMHGWDDLNEKIGDAFREFCQRIRYSQPTQDSNRSRWPEHELWRMVSTQVSRNMSGMISGATPGQVRIANRIEHQEMLDRMLLGLLFSRAAASGVCEKRFEAFGVTHIQRLLREIARHPVPPAQRLAKAAAKYRF